MSGLLQSLLPLGVWGAQIEDQGQPAALHPGEAHLVAGAAPSRVRHFALGRACARAALLEAGLAGDIAIGRGMNGAPAWPDGLTGSITHTQGYAAAIVARTMDFSALGVDAERLGGVEPKLWPRLFDMGEREWLAALPRDAQAKAATALFSAKEACFKARPMGKSLAFHATHITLDMDGGTFTARQDGHPDAAGRYAMDDRRVVTAVFLPAR